ncbi:hypothetical protein BUALT_Bualt01G0027700 [Buddleja alternifolia]|uniref:B box-type domain-containing protein n=1 Tax=Buddleja alternifolia TaxID=168488 RepID=A0AAV6Y412_9LAMI|nr:hypothetical protein BUALT_Bualt01G0027700 [Buddleja alternifolia]
MKIQCDVCDKDEASIFCVADEATLCAACDHRVHHANKLAGKHHRFSLHHPSSPKQIPLCDICKEKRAFLFCQQDRAILCKECDNSIHKANEHTLKHTRFLLTGVKLSPISAVYSDSLSPAESASSISSNGTPSTAKSTTVGSSVVTESESCEKSNVELMSGGNLNGSISTSSISEYLIETLPGWHVEDFLDSSSPYGFSKNGENDGLSFWDADLESNMMNGFPNEKMGLWVPQAPPPLHQTAQNQSYQSIEMAFGASNGLKEQSKEFGNNNIKFSRKWSEDNSFAVPQITPSSIASKRSRNLW